MTLPAVLAAPAIAQEQEPGAGLSDEDLPIDEPRINSGSQEAVHWTELVSFFEAFMLSVLVGVGVSSVYGPLNWQGAAYSLLYAVGAWLILLTTNMLLHRASVRKHRKGAS